MSSLQRRGKIGVVVFAVFTMALWVAMVLGADFVAWCIAPFACGSFTFTLRTIVIVGRLRAQHDEELYRRAEERVRRERLRQELRTLAAPDAVDGQCPVCGYDDLDELAAVDAELEEPGSRFTRVVSYGARRAHQECAELVPYKKTAVELAVEEHETDHHGSPAVREFGCVLCAQETREQLAEDPEVDRPIWPPLGLTAAQLSERLQAAFGVPPIQIGEPTAAERAVASGAVSQNEIRREWLEVERTVRELERSLWQWAPLYLPDRNQKGKRS